MTEFCHFIAFIHNLTLPQITEPLLLYTQNYFTIFYWISYSWRKVRWK